MAGQSKWRKMKLALGLNTCLYVPESSDDGESVKSSSRSCSDARRRLPITPTPSSSGLRVSKYSDKSTSEPVCAICLMPMKATGTDAIFKAECTHSFHYHCIASNVKYGNRACPVCRAKWKEIPLTTSGSCVKANTNTDDHTMVMSPQQLHAYRNIPFLFQAFEPPVFDDDERVNQKAEDIDSGDSDFNEGIDIKAYPEVSTVARSTCFDNFSILINIKAPVAKSNLNARASIDLVTMLDISGSMTGTKIALLKQAMGFVVQNLGPWDRLSVIVFSSTACRLFPFRRMTETGKRESLQMINSLVANGGTNIAEALRKGAKVMTDRKFKNPVSSMILLSDGQDSDPNFSPRKLNLNYQSLSSSIQVKNDENRIPIHTFGFGTDHDACALHAISEHSGGMFSFIEAENVIQDAFAQCIGGLLSVVVQELRVEVECVHPVLRLGSIKAGSYKVGMDENARSGFIEVGDLYAEEERDFLVTMDIPVEKSSNIMSLVKFRAIHKDPIKKMVVTVGGNEDLIILRPETSLKKQTVSIEVDRQRNRLMAADAISEARTMAERGNLTAAVSVLEECRKKLADSVSGRGGDRLCVGLMAELREMKERMVSHRVYESSGRAYVLSGLSSHSWQRATARGDSTETTSIIQSYQTQTMVNMVNLSQTTSFIRSPSTSMVSPNSPKTEPLKTKKSLRSTHSFT
ncbi:putative transcription factor C2H2 family [Helianthus annuus]|nr:E3 ubiquitin-protein ligase WAV3 [Helianthus annuus]KAJ0563928.1 putative transcription factor C2H2 family [Helianthus annuus]KAJ0732005.1 putative transcription factor C2H2 family [Helianthus annuus]